MRILPPKGAKIPRKASLTASTGTGIPALDAKMLKLLVKRPKQKKAVLGGDKPLRGSRPPQVVLPPATGQVQNTQTQTMATPKREITPLAKGGMAKKKKKK